MIQQVIKEDLLHYVWRTKQIDLSDLLTTTGKKVEIIDWGTHNHDSGPDFFNGRIKIDGTLWVGNIEMHIFAGDWEKHSHDSDPAYDNVILHVVYEEDSPIFNHENTRIPCIEIKDRIASKIKTSYGTLIQNNLSVPCENLIQQVDPFTVNMWKDRLIAERLESKSVTIKKLLDKHLYDWEVAFYISLSKYMGARINIQPFELLAELLPLSIIRKNSDCLDKVEALLFGVAGMLDATYDGDKHHTSLKKEFDFLAAKYGLNQVPPTMWKFSKMRPPNFPTVRIAQLAALLQSQSSLFSKILEAKELKEIRSLFAVAASPYWDDHFRFGTKAKESHPKVLVNSFIDILIINVVAPTLFLYGQEKDEIDFCERAIALLNELKPEKNSIIDKWKSLGLEVKSAMDSQSLLHLRTHYCDHKKCLACNIGNKIVHI